MPFAPGVEDRSGQIRAQGYLEKVRGISMGAESVAKQYAENKFRNQAIQGQNEALLKQFITDPEMEKFAPEGATKLIEKAQQGGGLSLSDNIKLNGYLNTTLTTRKAIQDQQMESQKRAMMQQQMQMNQIEMEKAKRQQAIEMARQAQLAQLGKDRELVNRGPVAGFGTGVMDAEMRGPAMNRVAQADTNPYLRVAEQANAAGVPIGAAMEYDIATRKASGPQQPTLKNMRGEDAKGRPIQVTVDVSAPEPKTEANPYGFRIVSKGPMTENRNVLSAEDQVRVALETEEGKEGIKSDTAYYTGVTDAADAAQATLPQIKQIREIYDRGAETGFGQEFVTAAGAVAQRMGIGDAKTQADREELQKLFAGQALANAQSMMKGQGSVTQFERELVSKAGAELGKSKEANLRIIRYAEALAERSLEREAERQRMVDEGMSRAKITEQLKRWTTKNPLEKYLEKKKDTSAAPAQAAAAKKESEAERILREAGID